MWDRLMWDGTPWCFHFRTLRRIQGVMAIMPCPCRPVLSLTIPRGPSPFCQLWHLPIQFWSVCLPRALLITSCSSLQHPLLTLLFPVYPVHWVPIQSCLFQAYSVVIRVLRPLPHLPLPAPASPPMPMEVCLVTQPVGTSSLLIFTITFSPGTHIFHLNI